MELLGVAVEVDGDGAGIDGGPSSEAGEAALLRLPILIVGIGDFHGSGDLGVGLADGDEAAGILEGQRCEEKRVDGAEDGGGGSDAEGQGEDGGEGEARGLAELASGVAEVGHAVPLRGMIRRKGRDGRTGAEGIGTRDQGIEKQKQIPLRGMTDRKAKAR